jgi:hypothetical protein
VTCCILVGKVETVSKAKTDAGFMRMIFKVTTVNSGTVLRIRIFKLSENIVLTFFKSSLSLSKMKCFEISKILNV